MRKKGVSPVIATILLILIVLLVVGAIWSIVSVILQKGGGDITTSCVDVRLEASTCLINAYAPPNYLVQTSVERKAGSGQIKSVKLIFEGEEISGGTQTGTTLNSIIQEDATDLTELSSLVGAETVQEVTENAGMTYIADDTYFKPLKFSVAAIVGNDKTCDPTPPTECYCIDATSGVDCATIGYN